MKPQAIAIVAIALMLPYSAWAQSDTTQSALLWFNSFDQNGDGVMAKDEVLSMSDMQFARADADHDGGLSLQEYTIGVPADRPDVLEKATRRYEVVDRDQNGVVTEEEYSNFGLRVIDLADTNADGMMSQDEFLASISSSPQ